MADCNSFASTFEQYFFYLCISFECSEFANMVHNQFIFFSTNLTYTKP